MASLDNIVTVSISVADRAVDQAGFGIPMVVGPTQAFGERVRTYTAASALTSMVSDGFAVTTPEYKAVAALLASSTQRPTTIKVGRRAAGNVPTQAITFTPVDVIEGKVYTITINGTEFSTTADATPTATEIATALHTAINAGSEPVTSTDNTGSLTLDDDVAGAQNDIYASAGAFSVDEGGSDANVATELAAILTADASWYGLVLASNSTAENLAAAAWANSNKKLFVAVSADTDQIGAGSSDMASTMETAAYHYAGAMYHQRPMAFAGAAWLGQMLATDPGSATWKFRLLSGIATSGEPLTGAAHLSATAIANLAAKTANYYVDVGGTGMTFEGYASSGRFFDVTRFVDWLSARLQEDVVNLLINSPKVPYTDGGIAQVQGRMLSVLEQGVDSGGLAKDPRPTVTVPLKSAVAAGDVAARNLPSVQFSATYSGAIHNVAISGTLTL